MEDMGELEMDMESMMGGGAGKVKPSDQTNVEVAVLSNIEQSCRALQQLGMILSAYLEDISIFYILNI